MIRKILITGGNGFIGSHLIQVISKKYSIISFDIEHGRENIEGVTYVKGDISDFDDFDKIGCAVDGIIHLGAISRVSDGVRNPRNCLAVNIMGTVHVLEVARQAQTVPWIILGSTIEPPANIYGLSKHIANLCSEQYYKDYGLRVMALQFAPTYGSVKDNRNKLIPKLVRRALQGQEIVIDNGKKVIDFIFLDDLMQGIMAGISYLESCTAGCFETIPLCTGHHTDLKQLAEVIVTSCNSQSTVTVLSEKPDAALTSDPQKAHTMLGFKAGVDIAAGIRRTVEGIKDLLEV